jgi:hypothetical protein
MPRGQTVSWTLAGDSRGIVTATQQGAAGFEKYGAAAQRTTERAAKLADGIGKVSTTLARSASAFGLPAQALRTLDDVMDVTELGFQNLTKSAVGFNAASAGVVGAGLAIGTALGTMLRQIDSVRLAADRAAISLHRMMFGGGPSRGSEGFMPAERARLAEIFAQVQGRTQVQELELARGLSAAGLNSGQIRDVLAGKEAASAAEQFLATLEKQEKQAIENARAAERAQEAWVRSAEAARREWDKFHASLRSGAEEAARKVSATLGARAAERADVNIALSPFPLLKRGPDLSGVMGAFARGEIATGAQQASTKIDAATKSTEKWVTALSVAAHAMTLLGIEAESTFGRILNRTTAGAALGAQVGGGIGAAIGAGIGLLSGLFGGGPSKEERERMRREEQARREAIQREAQATRARGVDGLMTAGPAFFRQRTITTADDAQRQGALFAAAWGTVVKEKGIVAAAAAFKDAFAKMKADIEAAGIEAPEWMKIIGGQVDLGLNEEFKAVAEAAHTAAEFLRAFAESGGILTPDTLRAFEQEARRAFEGGKSIAAGLGQEEAQAVKAGFAAANPILQELLNQSIVSGQTLSADIQEMIRQAGIVPSVDVQSLDELRAIRRAVEALAHITPEDVGGGGGRTGGRDEEFREERKSFKRGGRIEGGDRVGGGGGGGGGGGVDAILHPPETVVTDSQASGFALGVLASGGRGSTSLGEMIAEQVARKLNTPVNVQVAVPVDTTGLPRHSREQFLEEMDQRVRRAFRPGSEAYRDLERAVRRIQSKG